MLHLRQHCFIMNIRQNAVLLRLTLGSAISVMVDDTNRMKWVRDDFVVV